MWKTKRVFIAMAEREGESMKLSKWNYETREYDEYEVPDDWNCKAYSMDMNEIVNCPHCGRKVEFGNCYTSMEIHTKVGFGFSVCEECYEEEIKRKRENDKFF